MCRYWVQIKETPNKSNAFEPLLFYFLIRFVKL
jgi:hypothetical protein